jgi:hypothetical protein
MKENSFDFKLCSSCGNLVHEVRVMLTSVQNKKSKSKRLHSRMIGEHFTISGRVPKIIAILNSQLKTMSQRFDVIMFLPFEVNWFTIESVS